jgi:hypothetical protein
MVRLGDHAVAAFSDSADYVVNSDGSQLAVSGVDSGRISVVRMLDLSVVSQFPVVHAPLARRPEASLLSWPRAHTIIGCSQQYAAHRDFPTSLLVIDPVAHRVRSVPLHATVVATAVAQQRTLLLVAPLHRVGPARLVVVSSRGRVRSVGLPNVAAGFGPGPDWDNEDVEPGLMATTHRADVVDADGVVTEVELATLDISESRIAGVPLLAAEGKPMDPGSGGVMWNDDANFAAAGSHRLLYQSGGYRPIRGKNQLVGRPIAVVNTHTWRVVRLYRHAFDAWHTGGLTYVATGRGSDQLNKTELVAMDPSGGIVFRRQGHGLRWDHSAGVLVERGLNGSHAEQLDPRSGRVIARIDNQPYPLDLFRLSADSD